MGLPPVTRFVVSKFCSTATFLAAAARVKSGGLRPRAGTPLHLTDVHGNDPVQRITPEPGKVGTFRISGTASNHGIIRSYASLTIRGNAVTTHLGGGMTPKNTADAIARNLPHGYSLKLQKLGASRDADVLATVVVTARSSSRR